ncbi:hypothetical protein EI94DRAFT_555149 [Lactarius quietus]|nr:hypothetical protein EI94DRAFT_555149 [Lactarius quietus]
MAQTLEAEDEEQRQRRLQNILERLNGDGPSETTPHLSFDFGDRRTFAVEPPSELLARVQQFLPQIEQSNEELLQRDPRSIDMEHIEETDESVIQMNLGLGVFEQRRANADSASSAESGSDTNDSGLGLGFRFGLGFFVLFVLIRFFLVYWFRFRRRGGRN